jgi:hypothetical protein
VEQGTAEVAVAAGALLAIMPDPDPIKKRTGFGTHHLPGLRPESSVSDSEAECAETNGSTAPPAGAILPILKSGQVLVRTFIST